MTEPRRVLRPHKQRAHLSSESLAQGRKPSAEPKPVGISSTYPPPGGGGGGIRTIPHGCCSKLPGLTTPELRLLRQKQRKLARTAQETLESLPRARGRRRKRERSTEPAKSSRLQTALEASLIFAQYEAGSAVCIHPDGWVLTCAHCLDDSDDDEEEERWRRTLRKRVWLLNYMGLAVQAECRAWDPKRDLALLKIVVVETQHTQTQPGESRNTDDTDTTTTTTTISSSSFPYIPLSSTTPAHTHHTSIICLGQPGLDDLESTTAQRTTYNLLEVSRGKLRWLVPGADTDPHDNSAIGTLMHA